MRPWLALYWSEHSPELRYFQCEMARWPLRAAATQPKIFARERAALASQPLRATRGGVVLGTKPGLAKGRQSAADAQGGWL